MQDDLNTETDPSGDQKERAGATLMKMMFPTLFEKAILGAQSEEERIKLCEQFVDSPFTEPESIAKLNFHISFLRKEQGRDADADVLSTFARKFNNLFINQKADKVKHGLSVQCMFRGKVFASMGQALNEGYTEWITQKAMDLAKEDEELGPALTEGSKEEKSDGTYFFEVKFADNLVKMKGEKMVTKAYFGTMDDWQELADDVDADLGNQAFLELLFRSDLGDWKYVFGRLRPYLQR